MTTSTQQLRLPFAKAPPKLFRKMEGGFLAEAGYTHAVNPAVGCPIACSYCYVKALVVPERMADWGEFYDVKDASGLEAELRRLPPGSSIFCSSGTEPLLGEKRTRFCQRLINNLRPDLYLIIQTRLPLVASLRIEKPNVGVSMTIETDSERILDAVAPKSPSVASRLKALAALHRRGVFVAAAIAPILEGTDYRALESALPRRIPVVLDAAGSRSTHRNATRGLALPARVPPELVRWFRCRGHPTATDTSGFGQILKLLKRCSKNTR